MSTLRASISFWNNLQYGWFSLAGHKYWCNHLCFHWFSRYRRALVFNKLEIFSRLLWHKTWVRCWVRFMLWQCIWFVVRWLMTVWCHYWFVELLQKLLRHSNILQLLWKRLVLGSLSLCWYLLLLLCCI